MTDQELRDEQRAVLETLRDRIYTSATTEDHDAAQDKIARCLNAIAVGRWNKDEWV
jgi:uncharacterized protein (DUF2267 family)